MSVDARGGPRGPGREPGSLTLPTRVEPARALVVCPACRGELRFSVARASCLACGREFPQPDERYLDLFPRDSWDPGTARWAARQGEMEVAYQDLVRDPVETVAAYRNASPTRELVRSPQ